MSFFGKWNPVFVAAALLAATGCTPGDQGAMDEEKEPHYVLGKSRVNAMNYSGAIEAFEESLEANPHSAEAHYQLGILYDSYDSVADPAAAIYHYQQCLKYDPKFPNADAIAGRIETCKQKLAENVLQLPSAPAVQQQLEKLADENRRLHDQLAQWQAYAAQLAARTNQPSPTPQSSSGPQSPAQATSPNPDDLTPQTSTSGGSTSSSFTNTASFRHTGTTLRNSAGHTHTVARGETMASIARRQGITLSALEEANPSVNPKKLKAGQVLNLP